MGAGEAGLLMAAMLGDRLGVVTFVDETITAHERRWRISGLNHNIVAFGSVGMWFNEFTADPQKLTRRFVAEAERQIAEARAEVILADCGFFFPHLPPRAELEARLGVPVVDPLAAALKFAEVLAGLGHRHSRRTWPKIADFKMFWPLEGIAQAIRD